MGVADQIRSDPTVLGSPESQFSANSALQILDIKTIAWWVFIVVFSCAIALRVWSIWNRRNYWFRFVVSSLSIVIFPTGTVSGIASILILGQERVRNTFHPGFPI
jgi:hypothetical protein